MNRLLPPQCFVLLAATGLASAAPPMAPAELPGKGLAQHPFFYAGEDKVQSMFVVKDGKIAWSHTMPNSKGEISDAFYRANGNILFAHQFGITEISPEKAIVWHLDAPKGCEIHTAQPLAGERVMYVQNGDPARLRIVSKASGKTDLEFTLPVKQPKGTHGQFRYACVTERGTFLVAHMDLGRVAEYDSQGKPVWSVDVPSPWSASRLASGNTLITSNKNFVREVDTAGKTVWELTQADVPEYKFVGLQKAVRLANGNTLVNNWWNNWSRKVDFENPPVQALEVTPNKRVVWALRAWKAPTDLGPSTTIQLLDENPPAEDLRIPGLK